MSIEEDLKINLWVLKRMKRLNARKNNTCNNYLLTESVVIYNVFTEVWYFPTFSRISRAVEVSKLFIMAFFAPIIF